MRWNICQQPWKKKLKSTRFCNAGAILTWKVLLFVEPGHMRILKKKNLLTWVIPKVLSLQWPHHSHPDLQLLSLVHDDSVFVMTMCSWWQCIREDSVIVMTMCSWWQCIREDSVFVMTMCSWWQCVCDDGVFVMTVCLWGWCVCDDSVFVMTMCSWWRCVRGDGMFVMAVCLWWLPTPLLQELVDLVILTYPYCTSSHWTRLWNSIL